MCSLFLIWVAYVRETNDICLCVCWVLPNTSRWFGMETTVYAKNRGCSPDLTLLVRGVESPLMMVALKWNETRGSDVCRSCSEELCRIVTAALFLIAKKQNQPQRPATGEWIKKTHIYLTEYYSAIQKNKILSFGATWGWNWKSLSEIKQAQKNKYYSILFIYSYKKSKRDGWESNSGYLREGEVWAHGGVEKWVLSAGRRLGQVHCAIAVGWLWVTIVQGTFQGARRRELEGWWHISVGGCLLSMPGPLFNLQHHQKEKKIGFLKVLAIKKW